MHPVPRAGRDRHCGLIVVPLALLLVCLHARRGVKDRNPSKQATQCVAQGKGGAEGPPYTKAAEGCTKCMSYPKEYRFV